MAKFESFIPLDFYVKDEASTRRDARAFYERVKKRRSVREFSEKPIPEGVIENALLAAGTAPSGANMQPWHFVVIKDQIIKTRIRKAAEVEERKLYEHRASEEWLRALEPLGTNADKPFLGKAPALIAIFQKQYTLDKYGQKYKNYYPNESTGIATGVLITALHYAGLATLTHTPSPMNFLGDILNRPTHEKAFLLLVVGYPAEGAQVPNLKKRSLEDISTFM